LPKLPTAPHRQAILSETIQRFQKRPEPRSRAAIGSSRLHPGHVGPERRTPGRRRKIESPAERPLCIQCKYGSREIPISATTHRSSALTKGKGLGALCDHAGIPTMFLDFATHPAYVGGSARFLPRGAGRWRAVGWAAPSRGFLAVNHPHRRDPPNSDLGHHPRDHPGLIEFARATMSPLP